MNETRSEYDLAIVGGGLVGGALALALADSGLRIALVEAVAPKAADQPSYDDRTLALNHVSCRLLERLGLGDTLTDSASPIRSIHVSDKGRFGRVLLRAEDYGLDAFGRVLEARLLGAAVLARLGNQANLDWLCPARLQTLEPEREQVRLGIVGDSEQPREIAARLVIGADGAESQVRALTGLPARRHDYGQAAVIFNATPEYRHQGCAYERFTPQGPVAVLPQRGRRVGVVYMVAANEAQRLLRAGDDEIIAALQQRFGYRLGRIRQVGKRASYPLRLVAAQRHLRGRVALIGNAAHTIHPISAQGFNLGLRDAVSLAGCLRDSDRLTPEVFASYQAGREQDQQQTIRYTDTLARVCARPAAGLGAARSLGLLAHQFLPGLQRRLVLGAMGYRAPLPALAAATEDAPA